MSRNPGRPRPPTERPRVRAERFGAIAELARPRALVFVDRAFARRLGADSPAWAGDPSGDGDVGGRPLSAPIEAHLQLTNRCDVGCQGCYTGATPQGAPGEWGLEEWKRAIDHLADRGVFHLALGGGESAILPWLGEVAAHARSRGVIPNLTTSGLAGLDNLLPAAHLFGQINVSMDGVGPAYAAVRGSDRFAEADSALRAIRAVKREVGINVVVTRLNFADLDEIIRYARRRRLNEVELLRFKPAGRGAATFAGLTCSDGQHRAFWPTVARAARRHRIRIRVDCSYTPMLVHHRLDRRLLERLAVYGCIAGDFLVGARANGTLSACSFAPPAPGRPRLDELGAYWDREGAFGAFRAWRNADEPCRSCEYLTLCRGGCKAVALHLEGDAGRPDPECPRVVDFRRGRPGRIRLPIAAPG
ncbi:MAG TPA: radical SAM protein [Kofleriaceae bacterium]|jgi:radical SAM protein with 4Fe4S-binding SPASM domain